MKTTKKLLIGFWGLCMALTLVISISRTAQAADSDFVIENGALTKYSGSGGNVVIPDGVTSIGDGAFTDCTGLTGVVIPDGVTSISEYTFFYCDGLTAVEIPVSVTEIGVRAFHDGILKDVYYGGSEEQWEKIEMKNDTESGFTAGLENAAIHYNSAMQKNPDIATPGEPTTPTDPATPTEPTTPTDPATPTEPTTPNNPATPTTPTTPPGPTAPTSPVTTTKPVVPASAVTTPSAQNRILALLKKAKSTRSLSIWKGRTDSIKVTLPAGLKKVTKFSGKNKGGQAKITYKSSNKKIATVTSKGKVKGKKKGTAKITVSISAHDGTGTCVRALTVKVKVK